MKKINTLLERIRDPFGLVKKKWFRVLSAVVLDSMLVMVLLFFLLYRCTNWTDGRVYWLPPDTIDLLIDGTLWACIALEFLHSPLRGVAALGVMLIRNSGRVTYPQTLYCEAVLVPLLANLGSMRNNRAAWLAIHAVGFEFLFFLRLTGQVRASYTFEGKISFLGEKGTSFALVNPNSLAVVCMSIVLLLWAYKKRYVWMTFLWIWIMAGIVFYLTWSRTVLITLLAFPFVVLLVGNRKSIRIWKSCFWTMTPVLAVLISIGISLYFIYDWDRMRELGDWAFLARFRDFRVFLDESFTLFGVRNVVYDSNHWFDNLYYWLINYCGVIPTAVALAGYGYMNWKLYKQQQFALLAVSVLGLIYGIMENAIIYPFHFFVPLLAFARDEETEPELSRESGSIITGKEVAV